MDAYRHNGGIINPDTPVGPADKTNNAQDWSGAMGTGGSTIDPAMDEDACAWDTGCGEVDDKRV